MPDALRWNDHGFRYLSEGATELNGLQVSQGQAAFFDNGAQELEFFSPKGCRCLLVFGQPHGEPIQQRGSFVD